MNKKIFGIALVAMSLISFSSMAQTSTSTTGKKDGTCQRVCKDGKQKCGKERNGSMSNPFEGLSLSADQQKKLKSLQEKRMAERKEKSEKAKASAQADRQDRMAKRKESRKQFLVEVKSILTPEQYVQFLENNFQSRGCKAGKGHGHGGRIAKKAFHKHDGKRHGDRMVKDCKKAACNSGAKTNS